MAQNLPVFIEVDQLATLLSSTELQIIDMSALELYETGHIPGATHLEYSTIIQQHPPIMGLLPEYDELQTLFSHIGLRNDAHIVVYDADGSGKSARLFWTLAACGFDQVSILNGGRHAWHAENQPMTQETTIFSASNFTVIPTPEVIADKQYILDHLDDPRVMVLDARSPAEFNGSDLRAARGGHIPGAHNLDWTLTFNPQDNFRIKSAAILESLLAERHASHDKEIIVHCQSHHRSALLFAVLKSLGYSKVRGYHGSWSEWGNCEATPIEA